MSYLLVIDTAHPEARVVLVKDGDVVGTREWENGKQVGIDLLKYVDEVLDEIGIELDDVERIAVHVGPGGYSSLRAGIVTAQMLAMTGEKELVEVVSGSIEEMAEEAVEHSPVEVITPRYVE